LFSHTPVLLEVITDCQTVSAWPLVNTLISKPKGAQQ
jgi:hypothetical protein